MVHKFWANITQCIQVYNIGFFKMYRGLQIDGKQYKNLTHHCLRFLQSGTEYTRGVFMERTWINNTKQQKNGRAE